jgi:hypothetical protein
MKKTPIIICSISILAALVIWAPKPDAYDTYSANNDATNCRACHGNFRASSYLSLSDGQNWGGNLHDLHRSNMLGGDCATCHGSPFFPVVLDSSDGGEGLEPIGCVGCHGRNEDIGNDSLSNGRGAGLRQHHFTTGVTACAGCHDDANPATYTPVGEDVPPSYYFTPDAAHPNKPTNPCNPSGEEDFAGSSQGLDNDGDNLYDTSDPDCQAGDDSDQDGIPDNQDNCPTTPNGLGGGTCSAGTGGPCTSNGNCGCTGYCSMDQEDADSDGVGDVCDNCPNNCNYDQWDADGDNIGDVCDTTPGCGCEPQCETECFP